MREREISRNPKRIKSKYKKNKKAVKSKPLPIEGVLGAREIDRRGSIESRGGSNCAPRDRDPEASDFGAGHSEE